jgi:hypothetical protein
MHALKTLIPIALLASIPISANEWQSNLEQLDFDENLKMKKIFHILNTKLDEHNYANIVVNEVLEPYLGGESELRIHNSPIEAGILVSPQRMAIPNGVEFLPVSVININNRLKSERLYRLDVISADFCLDKSATREVALCQYNIYVYVQPDRPNFEVSGSFGKDEFILHNNGNARFYATNGKECDESNECKDLPSRIVYSGGVLQTSLSPASTYVSYDFLAPGLNKNSTYSRNSDSLIISLNRKALNQ